LPLSRILTFRFPVIDRRECKHRKGLQADWRKVFTEAVRLDKAVEIDGRSDRQDLRLYKIFGFEAA
jgi:hypothetical protein